MTLRCSAIRYGFQTRHLSNLGGPAGHAGLGYHFLPVTIWAMQ